jgi:hypothetical protein
MTSEPMTATATYLPLRLVHFADVFFFFPSFSQHSATSQDIVFFLWSAADQARPFLSQGQGEILGDILEAMSKTGPSVSQKKKT